ncbi:MAG: hypothetical protein DRQ10_08735 [Candidatus Hydrothermota bacterium]|nr:MAG: hypothetical protein DRQ10_08735 [Candidatus Hydrothermae bacterium]
MYKSNEGNGIEYRFKKQDRAIRMTIINQYQLAFFQLKHDSTPILIYYSTHHPPTEDDIELLEQTADSIQPLAIDFFFYANLLEPKIKEVQIWIDFIKTPTEVRCAIPLSNCIITIPLSMDMVEKHPDKAIETFVEELKNILKPSADHHIP